MPSILSTNMASLYAQRNLASAQADLAGSVQKLSSGRQINSAKDNAAGLGISEGVMGVRNISDQSIRNLQSATSLVQTADGALDVVGKILQRALTLTTQKDNAILNDAQRGVIDNEIASLISEIGRIRDRTRFNSEGTIFGETYSFGAGSGVTTTFTIPELGIPELGINLQARTIDVDEVTLDRSVTAQVNLSAQVTKPGEVAERERVAQINQATAVQTVDVFKTGTVNAGDTLNITNHGFDDGDEVMYFKGSGNAIGGLADKSKYFVLKINDDSFQLAASPQDFQARNRVDLQTLGSSSDAYFLNLSDKTVFDIGAVGLVGATTNVIEVNQAYAEGDRIFFQQGNAPIDPTKNIGDFVNRGVYVVASNNGVGITLIDLNEDPVVFDSNTNLQGATLQHARNLERFVPGNINSGTESISAPGHEFTLGQQVFYAAGDIGGLTLETSYFVIPDGLNAFKLAQTPDGLTTSSQPINITRGVTNADFYFAKPSNAVTQFSATSVLKENSLLLNSNALNNGDEVIYRQGNGAQIGGLINGDRYFVVGDSGGTVMLSLTSGGNPIPLTSSTDLTGSSLEKPQIKSFRSDLSTIVNIEDNNIASLNHGFQTGDEVIYSIAAGGTAIGGLSTNPGRYNVIRIDDDTFKLAATADDAGNNVPINLSSAGTGQHNFKYIPASDVLTTTLNHGFQTGDEVLYSNSAGGSEINGLTGGNIYNVIRISNTEFKLALDFTRAQNNQEIDLIGPGVGTHSFTTTSDVLTIQDHQFQTGDEVIYSIAAGGTVIGGLSTNPGRYNVIRIDDDTFKLAATADDAGNNVPINLSSAGTLAQNFTLNADHVSSLNHGFQTGDEVIYSIAAGGTAIGGLSTNPGRYNVIRIDDDTFKLAATADDAGNNVPINLSSAGTLAQNFTHTPPSTIFNRQGHGFITGDELTYSIEVGGAKINELTVGNRYAAIRIDADRFELTAIGGNGLPIHLTSAGTGQQIFTVDADLIRSNGHGLFNGNVVTYDQNNGGIGGLSDEETYTVIRKDADFFSLAKNGVAIDLTTIGSGAEKFITQSGVITTSSIEGAIAINASNRAELGARLNTLSYAIDNLQTLSNNLSEAYSRIVDTDYAAETSNLTKNKILQEAATAMLAQANQMPNVILTLLK